MTVSPQHDRPLTPKQREIRARETRILDTAHPMIRRGGLSSISMNAIAEQIGVTRGTIYNHFPNKEDILLSLAARAVRRRSRLFQAAIDWAEADPKCGSRDACSGIGIAAEVYVDQFNDDFTIEQAIRHDPVWEKTSARRRDVLADCETACITQVGYVIGHAIAARDLEVPTGATAEALTQQIVFGLWSLVYGGLVIEATSPSLPQSGITQPRQTMRHNCAALLDQVGWQPMHDPAHYQIVIDKLTPHLIATSQLIRNQSTSGEDS
ncbi:MAG: TetR/AcrR family transcriptional regulator [Planctomycetota bacterium]